MLLPAAFAAAAGCAQGVYRVANLPARYAAPATANLEAVNLSGLADSAVSSTVIDRGDLLEVTMLADYSKLTTTTTPVRVGDDGTAAVPLIGKVAVAGLELEAAERAIGAAGIARGVFRNSSVTVAMKQPRMNKVTVVGAVEKPGLYELPRGGTSLLAAIVAAGGLSKEASPEVEIRHTELGAGDSFGPRADATVAAPGSRTELAAHQTPAAGSLSTSKVNLVSAAGAQAGLRLADGDVVSVTKRAVKPVYVLGLVKKPGELEMPKNQDLRLLDALAMAGGTSSQVADKVLVIRQVPGETAPVNIAVSIQKAKSGQDNLQLAPGDTVMVEQTPVTVLADTIQNFFRVGFSSSLPLF
jgi:polysaccharide biosynthesis/export protein